MATPLNSDWKPLFPLFQSSQVPSNNGKTIVDKRREMKDVGGDYS